MKKVASLLVGIFVVFLFAAVAAASDIPCSSESKKLEFYSCQMWRKPYKVGIKTDTSQFCEDVKRITPSDGCVLKDLVAREPAFSGGSKDENTPRDDGMHIFIIGPSSIDASSYELQVEPKAQGGIISVGLDIAHSLPGFTVLDLPGKGNDARLSAFVDAYKAKGKKFIGAVSFRAATAWMYPTKKLVTLVKYKEGKKLYEVEADVEGYKPTYGSGHGGNSDKPGAGGLGGMLKGLFNK